MIVIYIILSVLLMLVGWIVFVPLIIRVDTTADRYEIAQPGTFTFRFLPFQKEVLIFRIFGFRIHLTGKSEKKKVVKKKKAAKRKSPKSFEAVRYLIRRIPACIKVRYLRGSIDLNNVMWNANLMPVGYFVSQGPVSLSTNFYGYSFLKLRMDIKLYQVIWTAIIFSTKK